MDICETIKFPVSLEKMVWGSTLMTFLGLLLDTETQLICIPKEKMERAQHLIAYFMTHKKVTVRQLQQLTGFLNFLCRAIVPRRAFTCRLYAYMSSNMKPHHHIRVNSEIKQDLGVWETFLKNPSCYSRPFMDINKIYATDICMYSDASKSLKIGGLGAICDLEWVAAPWNYKFLQ